MNTGLSGEKAAFRQMRAISINSARRSTIPLNKEWVSVEDGRTRDLGEADGIVKGDVFASRRVELGPTARVTGNVYYNLIEMAIGAEINGKLVHQPEGQVPLLEQTNRIDEAAAATE